MSTEDKATGIASHPYAGVVSRLERDQTELAEMEAAQVASRQEQELTDPALDEGALGAEETTFRKRYGDLRKWTQKQLDEAKKEKQQLIDALREAKAATAMELPKTETELQEFANDYPDLFGLIETAILKRVNSTREEIDARFAELSVERRETAREKADAMLRKAHPDIDDIRSDEKFHLWAAEQSKTIRDALYKNEDDWQAASEAVDLYKYHKIKNKPAKKTTTDVDAATAVRTGSTTRGLDQVNPSKTTKWKESTIRDLHPREAERLWPEIEAAIAAGEVEYDITGAAR